MKRLIDIVLVVALMPVWGPVCLVLAGIVRWKMGIPVLFRQKRTGLHGQDFVLYKFRTMVDMRDVEGVLLPDEQRLMPFGRFLRSTSLDELPELWNVIRGDMSLVGPRPLLSRYWERYSTEARRRHAVRPGITGWAQVNGRNGLTWAEKFDLDLWYVDNQSAVLDLKILAMTLRQVLRREGISEAGHVTAREFLGDAE